MPQHDRWTAVDRRSLEPVDPLVFGRQGMTRAEIGVSCLIVFLFVLFVVTHL